jgi:uncharacterized glyoxalase superfamily protein PhnB
VQLQSADPVVVVSRSRVAACRDSYVRAVGFDVVFEASWFVSLQVADAAAEHARLRAQGFAIAYPVRDEPWGRRRFGLLDPAGTWVDVVQHIDPMPGFWEAHA